MSKATTETKGARKITVKGLYMVGQLADLLAGLGYMANDTALERDYEDDESVIPKMLADICGHVGAALAAVTQEEVAEMLAGLPATDAAESAPDVATKAINALMAKSGRTLSAASKTAMAGACKTIISGYDSAIDAHKTIKAGHDALQGMIDEKDEFDGGAASLDLQNAQRKAQRQRQTQILALVA